MHFKKLLSAGLSIVMALSMLPTAAFAADTDPNGSNNTAEYVLMNIPYADFYENELINNTIPVDGFTSATLNKTRTASLATGSYHVNADGTDISGITYPVKVGADVDLSKYKKVTDSDSVTISVTNRGQTSVSTYNGKDALFENEDYAYYVLDEEPSYYKEVTTEENGSLSFGKVAGTASTPVSVSGVTANLKTETSYGDYQLDLSGVTFSTDTVYAVVLTAVDTNGTETSYGLRHMENVWRGTALSWCTGFTDAVHGCPTSYKPYESMMGQTIKKITYYTSDGIYEMSADNYVPIKFENTFNVADSASGTGTTTVTLEGFPTDFAASYSIEKGSNTYDAQVKDGVLSYSNLSPGSYTLRASDTSAMYADITTSFVLSTTEVPAIYDADKTALIAASGHTSTELTEYLSGISSVSVNDNKYSASGRGSVQIIKADGTIDLKAQSNNADIFGSDGEYNVTVSSTGYPDFNFKVTISTTPVKPDVPSTEEPSTQAPSTEAPTPAKPSTEAPATTKPSTEAPAATEPSTEAPATQAPSTEVPSTQAPAAAKAKIKTYGAKAFSVKKSGATYKSSNKNVISVSKTGKATIKGVGKTVITVKTKTKTTKTTYIVKPGKIAAKSIKAVNSSSKKIKVTWKKKSGLGVTAKKAYYQIQYSTSKKFTKKTTRTLTVKGSASTKTISKLKKGKTYYVRMRGYDKTNKEAGSWSTVKKVKIKK